MPAENLIKMMLMLEDRAHPITNLNTLTQAVIFLDKIDDIKAANQT